MAEYVTITAGFHDGTSGNDNLLTSVYQWVVDTQQGRTTLYSSGARGFGGDDTLNNNGNLPNVLFDGGDGNDGIINGEYYHRVNNVSLSGGAGDDRITNYGDNPLITAGDGRNIVKSEGDGATITSGTGNDEISNNGDAASISSGAGNDSISHVGDDSTIDAGAGDDSIYSSGNNVTVRGGAGNDSMSGYGNSSVDSKILLDDTDGDNYFRINNSTNSTINAGNGADTVHSDGYNKNLLINVGAGNNSIVSNYDSNVTINAAEGNDTINFYDGNGILIQAGEGDNYIYSYNLNSNLADMTGFTISSGTGKDTLSTYGNRVSIVSGAGNDSVKHVGANSTIQGGDGDDYINNHDGGRDYSTNPTIGAGNLIEGGAGNDSIDNACNTATLNGGDGNDYISSGAVNGALLNGGNGNDTLCNIGNINREFATNTTINGGAGNDSIDNLGNNVTISGGTGNDTISLRTGRDAARRDTGSENVLINYTSGDGNDLISGFNETSTLSITNGSYTSLASGNDVVLTVGNGKISLIGAGNLETLNIRGTYGGDTTPAGTTTDDTTTAAAATVAEMILRRTEAGYPAMAALAFDPTTYFGGEPTNYASKENWEITSTDGLKLKGYHYTPENSNDKWVVIVHGYGHNHKHMYRFADFYLANGYNVLMVDQRAAGDSQGDWLTMGAAESKDIALWTQEIARRYSDAKITLFGVSMGSATVMMAAARSDTQNVTSLVEDCGYTNMMDVVYGLHSNVQAIKDLLPAELIPVLDTVASTFTGYNLSDAAPLKSIGSAKMPTLFITGTNDSVVPVSMLTALYDASGATVKEKFIVEGANHGIAGLTDPVGYSNTTFRFLAEANGEGWVTDNAVDSILLRGTKYGDNLTNSGDYVTITAGAGNDSLNNSGDNVTFNYASGDGNDVIRGFNSNSTLNLGNANYSSQTSGRDVIVTVGDGKITLVGTSEFMNLNIIGKNEGYNPTTLFIENLTDNKLVTGTEGKEAISNYGTNATINALGGDDTIYSNGENSKINAGKGNDSINNYISNFTFNYASGDGNDTITGFDATSTLSITGGSYTSLVSGNDVVLTVGDGKITLIDAGILSRLNISGTYGGDTTPAAGTGVTIDNGASGTLLTGTAYADSIVNSGSNVTINALDSGDVITNDGTNVTIDGGTGNDTITSYSHEKTASINGGAGNDMIGNGARNSTLDGGAGNDFISNGYGENVLIYAGAGNDTVTNYGDNVTISGGFGNDSIQVSSNIRGNIIGNNVFVTYASGDGNDTINGFNATSTLSIGDDNYTSQISGNDVIVTVGNGKITLQGAATLDKLNIVSSVVTVTPDTQPSGDEKLSAVSNMSKSPVTLTSSVETVDASGRVLPIEIVGNELDNSIVGGINDDTLDGGAGNDTLTGGKGKNVFVYTAGNDVITDYKAGKDSIQLDGGYTSATLDGSDVVFTTANGSLTVKDAIGKDIDVGDEFVVVGVAPGSETLTIDNQSKTHITLGTNTKIVEAKGRIKRIEIIGNDLDNTISSGVNDDTLTGGAGNDSILGNAGSDIINGDAGNDELHGGSGNDTLNGGAGNDSLWGDSGRDTFIYDSGNDVIFGFENMDKLEFGGDFTADIDGDNLKLTVGNGSITLKEFTATSFNINGESYVISEGNFIKR